MRATKASGYAKLLSAAAHPTRLMILAKLVKGQMCVSSFQELLDIPQPRVSQHLALLRKRGLVICHKKGALRCYHLAQPQFVHDLVAVLERDYPTLKTRDLAKCTN